MSILVDSPARVTGERRRSSVNRLRPCARLRNDSPQRCCRSRRQQRSGRRSRSRPRPISASRRQVDTTAARAPAAVDAYLDSLGDESLRPARRLRALGRHCFPSVISPRRQPRSGASSCPRASSCFRADGSKSAPAHRRGSSTPATFASSSERAISSWSTFSRYISTRATHRDHQCATGRIRRTRLRWSRLPHDVDGAAAGERARSRCWQRAARATFPNDPCLDELWGHKKIGWDSGVAARSLPRIVAVLDSGIDAAHEDLARNVVLHLRAHETPRSQGGRLNARCATSGRCYPHGTEMAGTIGGRMDNGIGVAGVAPNSRLLPIVISRVDRGLLARISTIAAGIDAAVEDGAEIINISAKWPVDSRAISEAIVAAVGGSSATRRLVVTGYATSLDRDDTVREYFPSQYRCLPGVIAAVPTDMRGHELFNPKGHPRCERRPNSGTWRGHRGDNDREFRARLCTVRVRGRIERGGLCFRCSSARLGKPAAQQVRRPADKTTAVLQEQEQRFHAVSMGQCRIPS